MDIVWVQPRTRIAYCFGGEPFAFVGDRSARRNRALRSRSGRGTSQIEISPNRRVVDRLKTVKVHGKRGICFYPSVSQLSAAAGSITGNGALGTLWIARHEGIASAGLGSGRANGILEVRPGERERPSHNVIVDLRDGEDADETFDALAGKCRITSLLEQIENRRDAVSGDHTVTLSAFDRCPQSCRDIGIGRTIENHVEEDV